jgi:cyclophilin family peptidyl-prolyl cis-trans isomerase
MANDKRADKKSRSQAARAARVAAARRRRQQKIIASVLVLALIILGIGLAANNWNSSSSSSKSTTTAANVPTTSASTPRAQPVTTGNDIKGTTPCPAADGSTPRAKSFENAPPMCIDPSKKYTADFDTTEGHVVVALDTTKTPNTANNFVVLSRYHYYDGTALFRTDTSIDIIQGGSPAKQDNSDPGPGYTIKDEGTPFTYNDGDLVMANTGGPNTSGAQFFFGAGPAVSGLNSQGSYLNFGHTTQGLDVLHKILGLNTGNGQYGGAPSRLVVINKITITESK